MSSETIKNDLWGKYGFPSYEDGSVPVETKLEVLRGMGYPENELLYFDSWQEIRNGTGGRGYTIDLAPSSIRLRYAAIARPSTPLEVELPTHWQRSLPGGVIPKIPTITPPLWLPYPIEKNEQTWEAFYNQTVETLREIESKLLANRWFFRDDSFDYFDYTPKESDHKWEFEGKAVDFHRVSFNRDYWGTLWYYK